MQLGWYRRTPHSFHTCSFPLSFICRAHGCAHGRAHGCAHGAHGSMMFGTGPKAAFRGQNIVSSTGNPPSTQGQLPLRLVRAWCAHGARMRFRPSSRFARVCCEIAGIGCFFACLTGKQKWQQNTTWRRISFYGVCCRRPWYSTLANESDTKLKYIENRSGSPLEAICLHLPVS